MPAMYNYVLPRSSRFTWGDYRDYYAASNSLCPSTQAIWYPYLIFTSNAFATLICRWFLHFLPAYLVDLGLVVAGKKKRLVRTYQKVHKFLDVITYFSTREWNLCDSNMAAVWDQLSERDRHLFDFNLQHMDWQQFAAISAPSLRLYLFKEAPETLQHAKQRQFKLLWLHRVSVCIFVSFSLWVLWSVCHAAAAIFQ